MTAYIRGTWPGQRRQPEIQRMSSKEGRRNCMVKVLR